MEKIKTINDLRHALIDRGLWIQEHDEFKVNGSLAFMLKWGDLKASTIKQNLSRALAPILRELKDINGFTDASRKGPRRAALNVIVTQIVPLLIAEHRSLQEYIELWKREHPSAVINEISAQPQQQQAAVLEDQFDHALAAASFDTSRGRDALYRQAWLTARVRSTLHQQRRPHSVTDDGQPLYMCVDLISAAIPTSITNVNDHVWPRLKSAIEGDMDRSTSDPFLVHLRQNWEKVLFLFDKGHMTVPAFDEYMWRALAPGQRNSIPALIRNADTLNGYATGVGSVVANAANQQLLADYAVNATDEQRADLQRRANQAEETMDALRLLRPEMEGARTGPLFPPRQAHDLTFEERLALRCHEPAVLIAKYDAEAKMKEADARAREAEAKAEEAKSKLEMRKIEWQEYQHRQHFREHFGEHSHPKSGGGLSHQLLNFAQPTFDAAVPNVPDQFHPQSKMDIARIAIWNTLEKASQTSRVACTGAEIIIAWQEAWKRGKVPHHENYHPGLMQQHAIKSRIEASTYATPDFMRALYPAMYVSSKFRKADTLGGMDDTFEPGSVEAFIGVKIRAGAHWSANPVF